MTDSQNLDIPGYHKLINKNRKGTSVNPGGVGVYIKDSISYTLRKDLSVFIPHIFELLFTEVNKKTI